MSVIGAAILQGVAALTSRRTLERCSLASFVFVRNLVSALVFFGLGLWLFGWEHFAHAFGPKRPNFAGNLNDYCADPANLLCTQRPVNFTSFCWN